MKSNAHHALFPLNEIWVIHRNGNVSRSIKKTYLYNLDPLKPHFYIIILGSTGVYIIFLISAQNIDCGYSLEPPLRGGSNEYNNLCFEQKYEKYQSFLSEKFQFLEVKFSMYLIRRVLVMQTYINENTQAMPQWRSTCTRTFFPMHLKKERWRTNNDKYENTDI